MSLNLVKTLGLSLAIALILSGCQNDAEQPAAETVEPVDAAPDQAEVAQPAAPALTGAMPSASTANNEQPVVTIASCNIELANGQSMDGAVPTVSLGADISIIGWFVDQQALSIGDPLVLKISNFEQTQYWDVPVTKRTERQDIVAANKANSNLANAGFDITLNLSQMQAGRYNVYLLHAAGGGNQVCGQGRSIEIK